MGRADKSDCRFFTFTGNKSSVSFLDCGKRRYVKAINLCFSFGSSLTTCCELFLFCACWVGRWVGGWGGEGGDCMNQFRLRVSCSVSVQIRLGTVPGSSVLSSTKQYCTVLTVTGFVSVQFRLGTVPGSSVLSSTKPYCIDSNRGGRDTDRHKNFCVTLLKLSACVSPCVLGLCAL